MWPNYRLLGVERLILSRIPLSAAEADACGAAVPEMDLSICRLEVSDGEVGRRLAAREPGVSQGFLLRVAPQPAEDVRTLALEHFAVDNGAGQAVTAVGRELLQRLGWPQPEV
jgi:hypothetical protein